MCVVKYKFTSKTGGFESYDSHQLLCGGMVEVNSEPFRIAWFSKRLYIHPGLFGGSKMVRFDWFLAKNQSGCCRFDPCFLKARLCFYKGLNLKNRCLALLSFFVKYKNILLKCVWCVIVPQNGEGLYCIFSFQFAVMGCLLLCYFFFPRRCGVDSPPMCPSLLLTINPYGTVIHSSRNL